MFVVGEVVAHAGAGRLQGVEEAEIPERSLSREPLLVHIIVM